MDLQKINKFLKKLKNSNHKIAVYGDSILDEYYNVKSNRISPEFPIPISLTSDENPIETLPGGAGNVVRQFINFTNIEVEFYSLLDAFAKQEYIKKGINVEKCIDLPNESKIPRKKRFYNGSFPLFRWDVEKNNFGISEIESYQEELNNRLMSSKAQVCIFSDYSKGVFSNNIKYFFKKSIIDPKNDPIEKWKNCDVFKPNRTEALNLSKQEDPKDQCLFFKRKINCNNVLITDSYKGFYGIDQNNNFFEYKSNKKETNASVIGGGDCFVSYLTLSLILGFDIYEASEISFDISYFYVTKNKNINLSYLDFYCLLENKYVDKDFLANRNFNLVFTNGCFDAGLTAGHIECLKFAKKQGDKLVVALNSDSSISRLKGNGRPILPLEERMKIISSLEFVDFVISFDEDTPLQIIKQIKPQLIVKGGDYNSEDVVGKEHSKVVIFPKVDCLSTTEKIKKLC